jgi:Protein of unknown function (DUF2510)
VSGAWQPPAQQPGGLMLRTRFFPLAFLLYLFRPRASIDGSPPIPLVWGDNPLPGVPPGRHHIRVWFPYMFFGDCGVADAVIDVPHPGMYLEYKAPTWFVFNRGSFPSLPAAAPAPGYGFAPAGAVAAPATPAPVAGAWHPDPTGRADQRYWDGQAWTGHVVRGGQQVWDAL